MIEITNTSSGTMSIEMPADKIKLERQIAALECAVKQDWFNHDETSLSFHKPALEETKRRYVEVYGQA